MLCFFGTLRRPVAPDDRYQVLFPQWKCTKCLQSNRIGRLFFTIIHTQEYLMVRRVHTVILRTTNDNLQQYSVNLYRI